LIIAIEARLMPFIVLIFHAAIAIIADIIFIFSGRQLILHCHAAELLSGFSAATDCH
jgi:hypothetical protein